MQAFVNRAREQLGIDVECQEGIAILRVRRQSRYTVIFLRIDRVEGEGVGEEMGITHHCASRVRAMAKEEDVPILWRESLVLVSLPFIEILV